MENRSKPKIRVAIYGSSFLGRKASGTAQTAYKLVIYMLKNHSHEVEITLLLRNENELMQALSDTTLSGCKFDVLDSINRSFLKSSRQFYRYAFKHRKSIKFDVLHFSVPRVYPFFYFFPSETFTATFHAGGDVTSPADKFVFSRHVYNLIIKLQWKRFNAIVSDSKFATNEITQAYSIPKKCITKIYLGADNFWEMSNSNLEKNTKLILVIGRWQRYKNVHTALDAISEINLADNTDFEVVLIGKSSQLGKQLIEKSIANFYGKLHVIDYCTEQEMKELYNLAQIVIHPSLNEGFGLPAFEAFGEGNVLIAHQGTPADELLGEFKGVVIENLINKTGVIKSLNSIKTELIIDEKERRDYLRSIGATWSQMTINYVILFKSILNHAQHKN
jgi:glycosyltransferase involved in cell wall biosynthesis